MARQPSGKGSAKDSESPVKESPVKESPVKELAAADATTPDDDGPEDEPGAADRGAEVGEFWANVRIDPIEIALPDSTGYTLRAYRLSHEVTEPEIDDSVDEFPALALPEAGRREGEDADDEADTDTTSTDEDTAGDDADEEETGAAEPEEVPVFLARRGRLLLFRSPEGLVEYVRGAGDHDLAQLTTWGDVRERIEPGYVIPLEEDQYELDLVVGNLRGGHDAWDPGLIIQAGEIARDVAHALRLRPVINALAAGSPLDDLDDGLRAVETGGFGAFFARWRLRKIDAQTTAALGWRSIIGKISAAVDWRN